MQDIGIKKEVPKKHFLQNANTGKQYQKDHFTRNTEVKKKTLKDYYSPNADQKTASKKSHIMQTTETLKRQSQKFFCFKRRKSNKTSWHFSTNWAWPSFFCTIFSQSLQAVNILEKGKYKLLLIFEFFESFDSK